MRPVKFVGANYVVVIVHDVIAFLYFFTWQIKVSFKCCQRSAAASATAIVAKYRKDNDSSINCTQRETAPGCSKNMEMKGRRDTIAGRVAASSKGQWMVVDTVSRNEK